jgi:RNA polymerase sigma-70 factor, ECF subfamily
MGTKAGHEEAQDLAHNDRRQLDCEKALADAWALGRATWPAIRLPAGTLAAHVARLEVPVTALVCHGADIYLACACGQGDRAALRVFEGMLRPILERGLARFRLGASEVDEVAQKVRLLLFTGSRPRILEFGGRGPLHAWLRTIVIRDAGRTVQMARGRCTLWQHDQDTVEQISGALDDPEIATLRQAHGAALQRTLDRSILALSTRAKTVLRLYHVEGLNIDRIGERLGVHRATVARWLTLARSLILANLRRELAQELRLSGSELHSLTGALLADLHISVDRVLCDQGAHAGSASSDSYGL